MSMAQFQICVTVEGNADVAAYLSAAWDWLDRIWAPVDVTDLATPTRHIQAGLLDLFER
jgi:hypothetical protein